MKKAIIFILVICILCYGNVFATNGYEFTNNTEFSDVKNYYPFSSWAVDTGIKYNLVFLENNNRATTRIEIVNILYDILTNNDVSDSSLLDFTDVSELADTLKKKIIKMSEMNIVSGYDDKTFRPNKEVTRAEFVTMLDRAKILANVKGGNTKDFIDISSHWAESSIKGISKFGIINGKGENRFCPEDKITPQEILIILERLVQLNCISSDKLVFAILDTFSCKQYTNKEQYLIEIMYRDFDKVQNDIKYSWAYKSYYDYENWQELATYNDLLYAMYFTMSYKPNINEKLGTGELRLERMKRYMLETQGLDSNNETFLNQHFTIKNLLIAVENADNMEKYNGQSWDKDRIYGFQEIVDMLKFSNLSELTAQEKGVLAGATVNLRNIKKYFDNNEMYFPMNAPVTKYMLTYTILKLQERYRYAENITTVAVRDFFALTEGSFETDNSKLPYNYYEYPYIIKGIPNAVYEKSYGRTNGAAHFYAPIQCHTKYVRYMDSLDFFAKYYFDLILNVDYREMNVEDFVSKAMKYGYCTSSMAREYAQYVIDNQIILEGIGCAIPGTISVAEPFAQTRVAIKFKVISANERKNLLYGDLKYSQDGKRIAVEYDKDEYCIYYDAMMSGVIDFQNGGGIAEYRLVDIPIIEQIYSNGGNSNVMP